MGREEAERENNPVDRQGYRDRWFMKGARSPDFSTV